MSSRSNSADHVALLHHAAASDQARERHLRAHVASATPAKLGPPPPPPPPLLPPPPCGRRPAPVLTSWTSPMALPRPPRICGAFRMAKLRGCGPGQADGHDQVTDGHLGCGHAPNRRSATGGGLDLQAAQIQRSSGNRRQDQRRHPPAPARPAGPGGNRHRLRLGWHALRARYWGRQSARHRTIRLPSQAVVHCPPASCPQKY